MIMGRLRSAHFEVFMLEDLLQIGALTKTHGVHGEVKVFPMTDDMARFKKLKAAVIDTGKEKIDVECEGAKFFKQFAILKFKGYDTIESIEKYCGKGLFVTRENAVKLKKDEYFICDIIGLDVINENDENIGKVTDVIQTGANDVYEIELNDGKTFLLPAIKDCVLNVDMDSRIMKIHILEGLI